MQNAKPYPMPAIEAGSAPCREGAGTAAPAGAPGLIPGGPEGMEYSLQDISGSVKTFPIPAGSPAPLGYPYPPPYTRYEFPLYTVYPHRTVGVLFFTQYGVDYRCSASSIGNHAIWTAGHCIHEGDGSPNGWSYDLQFIPAYKNGSPAVWWASWPINPGEPAEYNLWTHTDWYNNGDHCRDSAGAVMYKNSAGGAVSYIGWLGFAWNWPPDQHWHEIGYPAAPPFDGNKMIICASSRSVGDNPGCGANNPNTMGAGCDQTGGCSGGPWIKDFSYGSGATNYLNGNFSYYYIGFLDEIFSPYFDDQSRTLHQALVGDTPP